MNDDMNGNGKELQRVLPAHIEYRIRAIGWEGLVRLRAAPRNYQLDEEIVKKWPGLKLGQNKALCALVTKSLV